MLTVNANVSDSLVNGARGTVDGTIKTENDISVMVLFDAGGLVQLPDKTATITVSIPMLFLLANMKLYSALGGTKQLKLAGDSFPWC